MRLSEGLHDPVCAIPLPPPTLPPPLPPKRTRRPRKPKAPKPTTPLPVLERVEVLEGTVEVAVMPGDGHCLFSAILHQLKMSTPGHTGHLDAVLALRKQVVNYIKQQDYLQDGKFSINFDLRT